jgi:hypothetical protein
MFFYVLNGSERVSTSFFLSINGSERNSEFFLCEMVQNGILSIFIFHGMVRNKNTKFKVFSLRRNGSERNRALFSSAEWLGTEFQAFSVPPTE